ncbi:hypothetical protein CHK_2416 [Christensenella hongkongensis]|uniref:Uncharacterized protein n=1 Tax=Christensenella hongkongensis TaxID=270498 RepID=A0A0M2NDU1_9FIRM|nr:hypothetical protein CHK_2416 [Christensenella hongkongensis]
MQPVETFFHPLPIHFPIERKAGDGSFFRIFFIIANMDMRELSIHILNVIENIIARLGGLLDIQCKEQIIAVRMRCKLTGKARFSIPAPVHIFVSKLYVLLFCFFRKHRNLFSSPLIIHTERPGTLDVHRAVEHINARRELCGSVHHLMEYIHCFVVLPRML